MHVSVGSPQRPADVLLRSVLKILEVPLSNAITQSGELVHDRVTSITPSVSSQSRTPNLHRGLQLLGGIPVSAMPGERPRRWGTMPVDDDTITTTFISTGYKPRQRWLARYSHLNWVTFCVHYFSPLVPLNHFHKSRHVVVA